MRTKKGCVLSEWRGKIKTNNQYGEILGIYVLHRIENHFPDVLYLAEIICRFIPKTQNLRTDKSMSNHEERIYNSICINSHMKYKYCTTFVNNIEWLSHLVLLSKVIQNWKFANQKCYFWWYKSTNKFRNHSNLFLN